MKIKYRLSRYACECRKKISACAKNIKSRIKIFVFNSILEEQFKDFFFNTSAIFGNYRKNDRAQLMVSNFGMSQTRIKTIFV